MRIRCVDMLACTLLLLLLLPSQLAFAARCNDKISKQEFPNCRQLADNYVMYWKLQNTTVSFGIEIDQVSGWFALGLSEGGGMRGADVWVFNKDRNGNWTVRDSFAVDYVMPTEDQQQDLRILSVQESAGSTAITFTRPLETCDYENDQIVYPQFRQPYIFAHGDEWGYHGTQNRGTSFILLDTASQATPSRNGTSISNSPADDVKELPLLMPNITVPADVTSYLCMNFVAPNSTRFQITETNYTITQNKLVHHMLLYVCTRTPDVPVGKVYSCLSSPPECSYLYLIWVPGQDSEVMPPTTGFPFGKGSYQYFMLQVHYTNPDGQLGVKDGSGFNVGYTSNLRPNDLGILWMGEENFEIPAGKEVYTLPPNVCPSECTSKFSTDVNLTMSDFHMHQLGSRQTVQHLRQQSNGSIVEINPPNYRNYYDFNWQGGTFILPGGDTLIRGDAFITTCTYNSVKQKNTTFMGPSSFDEMCYNFLRYWPAQKIDRCITAATVNGTGYAQCANQQELFQYLTNQNYTDVNGTVLEDLVAKGFVVKYNTSRYENLAPYNRTAASATCATGREATAIGSNTTATPNTTTPLAPKSAASQSSTPASLGHLLLVGAGLWALLR